MTTILVTGAAGGIGAAVVRELLRSRDTRVFATSRSEARLAALASSLPPEHRPGFKPLVDDAGDFAGAATIAARVEGEGGLDAAVAVLGRGSWTSGPLLDLSPAEWQSVLAEMLSSHFAFARAIVPLLRRRPGSVYLALGGGSAFAPTPEAGLVSIAAAGQAMLTRVLASEATTPDPRFVELIVNAPVRATTGAASDRPDESKGIDAADVATVVRELIFTGTTNWAGTRADGPLVVMNERSSR
jgi:NAD(P)-dependent dehydrogenase (short-subunit alcohol dehydrogenase family)